MKKDSLKSLLTLVLVSLLLGVVVFIVLGGIVENSKPSKEGWWEVPAVIGGIVAFGYFFLRPAAKK